MVGLSAVVLTITFRRWRHLLVYRRRFPDPRRPRAIEAALVAGLTGVGVPPGPAVSAVLAYRLATYWLPVLPGWLCLRFLQHRQYV